MTEPIKVAVAGASGFTGGELLRLLLQHSGVQVTAATSSKMAGQPIHRAHPNLRGVSDLKFVPHDGITDAELVFVCAPHGAAAKTTAAQLDAGRRVIDLSADFRLGDPARYPQWYGREHEFPELVREAVYGLPELNRQAIAGARLVSGVGCMATAMNLALLPLARAGLLDGARVVVDGKIGSSAAGVDVVEPGMHAHRSRSLRLYAPTGHRHAAEVEQVCGIVPEVSAHSVELVRGILVTAHVMLESDAPEDKELWKAYRAAYNDEHFVRVVKERMGVHRGPDPKLVAGSNYADVSFHSAGKRIVATAAIDNLVKGAAGTAVQCMNLMLGFDETTALTQLPVFPQ